MSVDSVTGDVNVSYYDTRNDTRGQRFMTDVYLAQSTDGGLTWGPDRRVTDVSSNEHDCGGVFPCQGMNYGNQQGGQGLPWRRRAGPSRVATIK